jgi:hypothetical protein
MTNRGIRLTVGDMAIPKLTPLFVFSLCFSFMDTPHIPVYTSASSLTIIFFTCGWDVLSSYKQRRGFPTGDEKKGWLSILNRKSIKFTAK